MTRKRGIARFLKGLFSRNTHTDEVPSMETREPLETAGATPPASRPAPRRVEADIPLDVIEAMYTPPITSSKSSFRSDGADHERDQELALGTIDDRWNDEDRFTNKSGDPRIGTHRRTYEPAPRVETRE